MAWGIKTLSGRRFFLTRMNYDTRKGIDFGETEPICRNFRGNRNGIMGA